MNMLHRDCCPKYVIYSLLNFTVWLIALELAVYVVAKLTFSSFYPVHSLLWIASLCLAAGVVFFIFIILRPAPQHPALAIDLFILIFVFQLVGFVTSEVFEWRLFLPSTFNDVPVDTDVESLFFKSRVVYVASTSLMVMCATLSSFAVIVLLRLAHNNKMASKRSAAYSYDRKQTPSHKKNQSLRSKASSAGGPFVPVISIGDENRELDLNTRNGSFRRLMLKLRKEAVSRDLLMYSEGRSSTPKAHAAHQVNNPRMGAGEFDGSFSFTGVVPAGYYYGDNGYTMNCPNTSYKMQTRSRAQIASSSSDTAWRLVHSAKQSKQPKPSASSRRPSILPARNTYRTPDQAKLILNDSICYPTADGARFSLAEPVRVRTPNSSPIPPSKSFARAGAHSCRLNSGTSSRPPLPTVLVHSHRGDNGNRFQKMKQEEQRHNIMAGHDISQRRRLVEGQQRSHHSATQSSGRVVAQKAPGLGNNNDDSVAFLSAADMVAANNTKVCHGATTVTAVSGLPPRCPKQQQPVGVASSIMRHPFRRSNRVVQFSTFSSIGTSQSIDSTFADVVRSDSMAATAGSIRSQSSTLAENTGVDVGLCTTGGKPKDTRETRDGTRQSEHIQPTERQWVDNAGSRTNVTSVSGNSKSSEVRGGREWHRGNESRMTNNGTRSGATREIIPESDEDDSAEEDNRRSAAWEQSERTGISIDSTGSTSWLKQNLSRKELNRNNPEQPSSRTLNGSLKNKMIPHDHVREVNNYGDSYYIVDTPVLKL